MGLAFAVLAALPVHALDPNLNFAVARVNTGYSSSATTVVLVSGDGARLPAASSGDSTTHYNLVWWNYSTYPNPADDPNVEIVRVTNRSTDTLTVTRAQESTSASSKSTPGKTYKMMTSLTKKSWDEILYSLPTSGSGSPEGVVNGYRGRVYIDTAGPTTYTKQSDLGTLTGWAAGGGGGAQTPWAANINGAGYDLTGAGQITGTGLATTAGGFRTLTSPANILILSNAITAHNLEQLAGLYIVSTNFGYTFKTNWFQQAAIGLVVAGTDGEMALVGSDLEGTHPNLLDFVSITPATGALVTKTSVAHLNSGNGGGLEVVTGTNSSSSVNAATGGFTRLASGGIPVGIFQNATAFGARWTRTGYDSYELRLSNSGTLNFYNVTDARTDGFIDGSGNWGLGNVAPGSKLDVTGTVTATAFSGSGVAVTGVVAATGDAVASFFPTGTASVLEAAETATGAKLFQNTASAINAFGNSTGAVTYNLTTNAATMTLTGNVTLTASGVPASGMVARTIKVTQDGTGSRTLSQASAGSATLNTAAGSITYVTLVTTDGGSTFKWITDASSGGAMATDTIWDAAGDTVYATGADAATRLAIGTAGQFSQVNAGATAPQWSTFSGDATVATGGAVTIAANSVALTTDTTGNYVSGVSGTANEITSTHTPAEGSTATLSLPSALTFTGKTVTGGTFNSPSISALYGSDGTTRLNHGLSVYASGTAYAMTASSAAVDFGTTDPSLTITKPGTYLIFGRALLKYNAATFAGNQTAEIKLRRTNNTAADVSNALTTAQLRIITAITDSVGVMPLPPVLYTTANSNDAIAIFGSLSAAPGAGSVDVTEASILAIRLFE